MSLAARLRARFWELSPALRRPLRRLLREASLFRHRRRARRQGAPTRVVVGTMVHRSALAHPAIQVVLPSDSETDRQQAQAWLADQTETSAVVSTCCDVRNGDVRDDEAPDGEARDGEAPDGEAPDDEALEDAAPSPYLLAFDPGFEALPETLLESLLLVAATLDLPWVTGGWAPPTSAIEPGAALTSTSRDSPLPMLIRTPSERLPESPEVVGRSVPHITGLPLSVDGSPADPPGVPLATRPAATVGGSWHLRGDVSTPVIRTRRQDPAAVLADLPGLDGPPAILFLVPFLAVGGAERLLFDLIPGLSGRRVLVVTVEPHRAELGQTVDRCRELTPHVYTLGDWLPRETHDDALCHLIRRHRVETLVGWNGTVLFYDRVASWRRRFPTLRIFHQLYNHTGAWTDRCGPRLARIVDGHLAVNRAIVEGLRERGMPEDRIALVHHGVAVPELPPAEERDERRRHARRQLGLPQEATVAGTFIRFHRQKRPLDIVALAERCPGIHFLLVGGGPLEAEVETAIGHRDLPNLTRLPLRDDLDTLYDAIDLCLMTSSYEGLPVFLLDGLARGLPAVATAVGEIPELLSGGGDEGGGGELVERPGDLEAFVRAFDRLADPRTREQRGAVGRRTVVERFGLETYRQRYRRLLIPEGDDV